VPHAIPLVHGMLADYVTLAGCLAGTAALAAAFVAPVFRSSCYYRHNPRQQLDGGINLLCKHGGCLSEG